VRLRALSALIVLRNERAGVFFLQLLARHDATDSSSDPLDPRRSLLVLRRAVEGLALAAPDDRTVSRITPLLAHKDGRLRESVARALVQVGSAKARDVARARMAIESSPHVRAQLRLLLVPAQGATDRPARPQAPRVNAPKSAPRPR
jgi:hypothetical protein